MATESPLLSNAMCGSSEKKCYFYTKYVPSVRFKCDQRNRLTYDFDLVNTYTYFLEKTHIIPSELLWFKVR